MDFFNKSNYLLCDKNRLGTEIITNSGKNDLNTEEFQLENCEKPKIKRIKIDDSTMLKEMEENIERESNVQAEKTSLSVTNVENVIESPTLSENLKSIFNNLNGKINYEPKLTRAKAKELAMSMPDLPWPLTPTKPKIPSQIQALVKDDLLHEDSSDDEYDPTKDEHHPSEDECDNLTCSDLESEPLTPASNSDANNPPDSNHTNKNFNQLFKVPEPPSQLTEEESIGQRTRSKFCLNQTALEELEQQLVPPDIPPDLDYFSFLMHDPNWGEVYRTTEQLCEDDVEADPNYDIPNDYEIEKVDKEELRSDKGVKVTKKEMKLLYNELKEFIDLKKPAIEPKKKKSLDSYLANSSLNNSTNDPVIELEPERPKSPKEESILNEDQCKIIAMQFEQHVQLMSQHFLMSYMHPVPEIHHQSTQCKENLENLVELQKSDKPLFNISNLPSAIELVNKWEEKLSSEDELRENYVKDFERDVKIGAVKTKKKYVAKFNRELSKMMMESKALIYPNLLPEMPFRAETLNQVVNFPPESEKNLLAISLERHIPYKQSTTKKFICSSETLNQVILLICKELMPHKNPDYLRRRIKRLRDNSSPDNPIKFFFKNGYVPALSHELPLNVEKKAPKDQEFDSLPEVWRNYLVEERERENNNLVKDIVEDLPTRLKRNNSVEELSISSCDNLAGGDLQDPMVNITPNFDEKLVEKNDFIFITIKGDSRDNLSRSGINLGNEEVKEKDDLNIFNKENVNDRIEDSSMINLSLETPVIIDDSVSISEKKDSIIEELPTSRVVLKEKLVKNNCFVELNKENEENSEKNSSNFELILDETIEGRNEPPVSVNSDDSSEKKNDDEIAESMPDTQTIKKDTKNCGEIKELESLKRLLDYKNHEKEEELSIKFAESYIKKLHSTLKSSNPEALKNVIKYYLEYSDKLKEIKDENRNKKEKLSVDFHKNVSVLLKDYPKLCSDVLPFFTSQQVEIVDKVSEDSMPDFGELSDVESSIISGDDKSLSEVDENKNSDEMNQSSDDIEESFESESDENEEEEDDDDDDDDDDDLIPSRPWTRQEDKVLLENIMENFSEDVFIYISKLIGDRTPDEVEERWSQLYEIIQSLNYCQS